MARTINELKRYSREDIERMAKNYAMIEIVGGMYVGDFHGQTAIWDPDGSLVVTTSHTPGEMEDWRRQKLSFADQLARDAADDSALHEGNATNYSLLDDVGGDEDPGVATHFLRDSQK